MPTKKFWEDHYHQGYMAWDLGAVSTPLKEYINQLENKLLKILIPGGGNGYEAEFLFKQGFKNVFVADIASAPLRNLKSRVPSFPDKQLLHLDFFDVQGSFDLILEQTFFCALDPALRQAYAKKTYDLLVPGGKLVGLLFDDVLNTDKPPFGGTKEEYISYFCPYFRFNKFESCYNSIKPRSGRELFINLEKEKDDTNS